MDEAESLEQMAEQVETVRGTLSKAAAEMAGRKERVAELSTQIEERKARLDTAKKRLAQQERALERSYSHMGDLEKSAKQMDELNEFDIPGVIAAVVRAHVKLTGIHDGPEKRVKNVAGSMYGF